MRWSGWRAKAPFKDSVAPKVLSVVDDALAGLGAEPDPECWVVWGDDPSSRYTLLVPTPSGLVAGQRPRRRSRAKARARVARSCAGSASSSASSRSRSRAATAW